jgi:hypothetical protein
LNAGQLSDSMFLSDDSGTSPRHFPRSSLNHAVRCIVRTLHSYLYSLDHLLELGLFGSTVAALISHKVMLIRLHEPLSTCGVIFSSPCLFVFDVITLLLLHRGLASKSIPCKVVSAFVCLLVLVCGAVFASLYVQGNVELDWTRSVEVCIPFI